MINKKTIRTLDDKLMNGLSIVLKNDRLQIDRLTFYKELCEIQIEYCALSHDSDEKSIKLIECLIDIINKIFDKLPENTFKDQKYMIDLIKIANNVIEDLK